MREFSKGATAEPVHLGPHRPPVFPQREPRSAVQSKLPWMEHVHTLGWVAAVGLMFVPIGGLRVCMV